MKVVGFDNIDLFAWGNEITMSGIVMEGKDNNNYLVMLPMQKLSGEMNAVLPSEQEWYDLQNQLDNCYILGDGKVVLRKGQRILDQKICWTVYRRDKFKCRYCGIDNVPLTVDHIITWESGGATHSDNLLTSCRKCNKMRGNIEYGNWLQHKYYLEKSQFLTEETRKKNEEIVFKLSSLPKVSAIRSR